MAGVHLCTGSVQSVVSSPAWLLGRLQLAEKCTAGMDKERVLEPDSDRVVLGQTVRQFLSELISSHLSPDKSGDQ